MSFTFKQALPHLLGVLLFYLITVLYFSPIVFEGKMIFQSDILQWEGSAKEVLDFREATGEEALWTDRMFGGMPTYLIHSNPKGDITNTILAVITLGLPHPTGALFFGMIGMYILLLSFGVRPEISTGGAIAFAFNTFNLLSLEAGHNAKIWAICLIPLIIAGIHLSFSRKKILGASITAFAVLLQLKFNHLQITYYTLIIVAVYGISQLVRFVKDNDLIEFGKIVGVLVIAACLGVLGNAARLTSILEYGKYSIRGERNLTTESANSAGLDKDYAFNWSQGKFETFTLLIPNFYGGASAQELTENSETEKALRAQGVDAAQISEFRRNAPTYWGDQPGTGGPIYGGAIMIYLFILGLFFAPARFRNTFLIIAILGLLLSWGKNFAAFNYTLFDYLPGYNKFRAVSMALSVTLFAIPFIGSLGLENFLQRQSLKPTKKQFFIATGVTLGLLIAGIIIAGSLGYGATIKSGYPDWLVKALSADRENMLLSDALRSFIFITLTAALLFATLLKKVTPTVALLVLIGLITVDLWGVNRRYLNAESFTNNPSEQFFAARPADNKILQDSGHFRVMNIQNPFNEARTSYRFNSVGGYHGAKMGRYQDLIENAISPELSEFIKKAQEGTFDFESLTILNMLNTKYILAGSAENAVFQNPEANGPAWFPSEIIPVSSNEEEMSTLVSIDTKQAATIQSEQAASLPTTGSGEVRLDLYQPNKLVYEVAADNAGLAVFSEIYYPEGWEAYINGSETEILRVNYALRGLVIPEGRSTIEFRFNPESYYTASKVMVGMQYFILLLLSLALFRWIYSPKQKISNAASSE